MKLCWPGGERNMPIWVGFRGKRDRRMELLIEPNPYRQQNFLSMNTWVGIRLCGKKSFRWGCCLSMTLFLLLSMDKLPCNWKDKWLPVGKKGMLMKNIIMERREVFLDKFSAWILVMTKKKSLRVGREKLWHKIVSTDGDGCSQPGSCKGEEVLSCWILVGLDIVTEQCWAQKLELRVVVPVCELYGTQARVTLSWSNQGTKWDQYQYTRPRRGS